MTRRFQFANYLVALLLATLFAPAVFAQNVRGQADFTRFVAIGDSYGAGVTSASLVFDHQVFSPPAIIARQAGALDFQQPLVGAPGIGPEIVLTNIVSFPPVFTIRGPSNGAPLNVNLPRPYNNLSIPAANVNNVLTLTGAQPANTTARAFAQFILRGLGTPVDQALAQQPTFIYVWIGGNDFLGAVLSGTPAALTPLADFTRDYNLVLDRLIAGAPNAGIVVGNLPDVGLGTVPISGTLAPFLVNPATRLPVLGPDGKPIFFVADLGGGQIGQLPAGSFVLLTPDAVGRLGTGFGIPAALAALFPTLPDVGKPLPDSDVITPTEAAAISARLKEFNIAIAAAASSKNIPVADVSGLFNRVNQGLNLGGIPIRNSFLTGGFFSFDGFHLTDLGYTLFANEFIRAINGGYGTRIPFASITTLFANNAPLVDPNLEIYPNIPIEFSAGALESLRSIIPRTMTVAEVPLAEPKRHSPPRGSRE